MCVENKCDAEIIVNDLKGGFLKIVRDHRSFCKNRGVSTMPSQHL